MESYYTDTTSEYPDEERTSLKREVHSLLEDAETKDLGMVKVLLHLLRRQQILPRNLSTNFRLMSVGQMWPLHHTAKWISIGSLTEV